MKALIQRVKEASVTINSEVYSAISSGLLVFLGVEKCDSGENAEKLAQKLASLRIFEDEQGKMNKSLMDIQGEMLVVSQFTLCGDCKKGTRPSFDKSAPPEIANNLYEYFKPFLLKKELQEEDLLPLNDLIRNNIKQTITSTRNPVRNCEMELLRVFNFFVSKKKAFQMVFCMKNLYGLLFRK